MDKTNVIATVIISIAIGYLFALVLLFISIDVSVCTRMGYDAASVEFPFTPTCVRTESVPYSDVLSELDKT